MVAGVFVALIAVAGVLAYSVVASEREFDRLIAEGDHAVANDRHFQAIEAYSGAIALRPDSMLAHLKRGVAYQDQGQLESALRDLREAVTIDPSALIPLELTGDVNVALTRSERAVERYEAYIALDERNPRVLYKLGLARYRAGRIDEASDPLQQAIRIDPGLGDAYYVLGLVQRDQNQLAHARASLEHAARLSPAGQTAAREALADVYALDGDHSKAINQLEALAALDPTRAERLIALGLAQARAGREDAAVTTLGRAVERFPDAPQVYAALGEVWLTIAQRRGDHVALNKALEALGLAASRPDATSDTLAALGRASLLAGDVRGAERALRQAVSRVPVPPEAYLQLADVTVRDGRIQDARDSLVKYATLIGDERPMAAVATRIGDLSMKLGDAALAVRWFDRAMDEAGPTTALQMRLADAALRAGNVPRASQIINEGLAADPGHPGLLQLKRRLPR